MVPVSRRRQERRLAASPALWFDEEGARYSGIVCDVSDRGLFLQPLARLPSSVGVGSRVRVVYVADALAGGGKLEALAVVRWTGASPSHACSGLGLELVGEAQPIAALGELYQRQAVPRR